MSMKKIVCLLLLSVAYLTASAAGHSVRIEVKGGGWAVLNNTWISDAIAWTAEEGSQISIQFVPSNGNRIANVKVNGSEVSVSDRASFTLTVTVMSDMIVTAEFESDPNYTPPTYTLSISASGGGTVSYNGANIRETTSSFSVDNNTRVTVEITPDEGYKIASITLNGNNISTTENTDRSLSFYISSNTTLAVVFEEVAVTYILTISAKGNGEASYNGNSVRNGSINLTIKEGSNPRVDFSPDLGNHTKSVKLNGSDVSFSNNSYSILNMANDNTLDVDFEELEKKFTKDGITYEVSSFSTNSVIIGDGSYGLSIDVPEKVSNQDIEWTIEGFSDAGLKNNTNLAAIIWNPENSIDVTIKNPNLLLYVKDAKYAPMTINNVIVGDVAESIILMESLSGNNFYCPKAFTAKKITYSHRYRMRSGGGESKGWETIALPFDVQKIEHVEEGDIVPFAKWTSSSSNKPFWLYQLSSSGFAEADGIKANTPYIISMPNNEVYLNDYILRGTVTFSASNVEVKKSDELVRSKYGDRTFVPNFTNLDSNLGYYALNVNNDIEAYQGPENEGSVFIQFLRNVHPFEAYMISTDGTRSIGIFDGMTTAIRGIEEIDKVQQTLKVYNLNGQFIKMGKTLDSLKQELPTGIYIINGQKVIIK